MAPNTISPKDIPLDRQLTEIELQSLVCQGILKLDSQGSGLLQVPELANIVSLGTLLGLEGPQLEAFKTRDSVLGNPRRLAEFVNRLISRSILSRAWEQSNSDVFYFVTPYGREALKDLASFLPLENAEFVESLQDRELRERCGDILARTKHYDSMVRDAIAVLEDRLKKMPGVQPARGRRETATNALSPKSGAFTLGDDDGERESANLLYQGILGFYGNPFLHGLKDVEALRARQIIGFIDNLLYLLTKAEKR